MNTIDGTQIGRRISELLTQQQRSQYWLAKQIGTSGTYIQKLAKGEIGEPSWKNLRAIAEALGFESVEALLGLHAPALDTNTPPEELLRAAGWKVETVDALIAHWQGLSAERQLTIITEAQQRVKAAQRSEDKLRALLRDAAGVV